MVRMFLLQYCFLCFFISQCEIINDFTYYIIAFFFQNVANFYYLLITEYLVYDA